MAFYDKSIIKTSVDIIDVARSHYGVDVSSAGKCCCPFHVEKTPSCQLTGLGNGEKSSRFHCFGCGADGDVVDFVMKQENTDFTSACEKLISWYNLDRSVICKTDEHGKKLSKSELAAQTASKNVKFAIESITSLQEEYARGEITCDEYDKRLVPFIKMYEDNLPRLYKGKEISSAERTAFVTCFKSRIPKWLDQQSPVYRNGMVIKGKNIPLYTRKGTKLCEGYSNIIVSPGESSVFGAFVEIEPSKSFVLQDKDVHPDDAWKLEKSSEDPNKLKYNPYNIRYNAPDCSGCTIYVQRNNVFTKDKRSVVVDGQTVEKSYPPLFQKDKWYVDVHDVLDIKSLQRLLPEKFSNIELPDYLDHDCFKPNMCITFKAKGQDTICRYKLIVNEQSVYIKESKWSQKTVLDCLSEAGNNMDKFEDLLFDNAEVKDIDINSQGFEKACTTMKALVEKNPIILNSDDECIPFIARLSGKSIDEKSAGRN